MRRLSHCKDADITKQAEKSLAGIKKNIDSSFDKAVDSIVKTGSPGRQHSNGVKE